MILLSTIHLKHSKLIPSQICTCMQDGFYSKMKRCLCARIAYKQPHKSGNIWRTHNTSCGLALEPTRVLTCNFSAPFHSRQRKLPRRSGRSHILCRNVECLGRFTFICVTWLSSPWRLRYTIVSVTAYKCYYIIIHFIRTQ